MSDLWWLWFWVLIPLLLVWAITTTVMLRAHTAPGHRKASRCTQPTLWFKHVGTAWKCTCGQWWIIHKGRFSDLKKWTSAGNGTNPDGKDWIDTSV